MIKHSLQTNRLPQKKKDKKKKRQTTFKQNTQRKLKMATI